MTKNQIDYWRLKEEERANQAKEAEINRHNVFGEGLANQENARSWLKSLTDLIQAPATRQKTVSETTSNYMNSISSGFKIFG